MIELERKGKKGTEAPAERSPTGHLPAVVLQGPRVSRPTGWSPSEWRMSSDKRTGKP